jgi:hypothetical protein
MKTLTVKELVERYKAHDEKMKITSIVGKEDEVLMLTRNQLKAMVAVEYKNRGAPRSSGKAEDHSPSGNTGGGRDKRQNQKKKKIRQAQGALPQLQQTRALQD